MFSGLFGDAGPLAAMFLQPMLSRFASDGGLIPSQLFPNMNLLHHMQAQQHMTEQFQVMQRAAGADQLQLQNMSAGLYRMFVGNRPLDGNDWNAIRSISPILDQGLMFAFGANPRLYDAFFGEAGSQRNFARGLHNAGRYMQDPTTGRFGLEVDTVNSLASSLGRDLYPGDRTNQMYGITRSEAGVLLEQGSLRGFLTGGRNAEQMKPQWESSLKEMAGAVSAMRDLFGDSGHPDAPIQQLISALDGLTQGGLGSMGLGRVQNLTRQITAGARLSGLGLEGSIALNNMMAQRLRADGADHRLASSLLPYEQAFTAAARNSGMFRSDWQDVSRPDASQLASYHAQMLAASASSPMANDLAVLTRLAGEMGDDSAASRLLDGFRRGNQTVTLADGRTISLDDFRRNPTDVMTSLGVSGDRIGEMRTQFHTNRNTITRNGWIAATVQGNQLNELLDRDALVGAAQSAAMSGLGNSQQQELMANAFAAGMRELVNSNNPDDIGLLQDPTTWSRDPNRMARFTEVMRRRAVTALGGEDAYRALGLTAGSQAEFEYFSRMLTQSHEASGGRLYTVANDAAATRRQGAAISAIQTEGLLAELLGGYNRSGPLARLVGNLANNASSTEPIDLERLLRLEFGSEVPELSGELRGSMERLRGLINESSSLGSYEARQEFFRQRSGEVEGLLRAINQRIPGGYRNSLPRNATQAYGALRGVMTGENGNILNTSIGQGISAIVGAYNSPNQEQATWDLVSGAARGVGNFFSGLNQPARPTATASNNRPSDKVYITGGTVKLDLANSNLNFAPPGGVASTPNPPAASA